MFSKSYPVVFLLIFLACRNPKTDINTKSVASVSTLPAHLQYAKAQIREADFWDQGFYASDSFYLWSWDDFGKAFGSNRITRTICEQGYAYSFWIKTADTLMVYQEVTVPRVQLVTDTMYDVNGDSHKDLVIVYNNNNGRCSPDQTLLFMLDDSLKKFLSFEQVSGIANARFFPKKRRITSEVVCDCIKTYMEFEWTGTFMLEKRKELSKKVCY